jgi:hypothetical protein
MNLRWMVDADADDVLLPGPRGKAPSSALGQSLSGKSDELAAPDPVDLTQEKVPFPVGWTSLEVAAAETSDPWLHESSFNVLTYYEASDPDSTDTGDFHHSSRLDRVAVDDASGYPVCADQVIVIAKDGTTDDQIQKLCTKYDLHVAGVVRRDNQFLLEANEPLDLTELQQLGQDLSGESCVDSLGTNRVIRESEPVASVRVADLQRNAAILAREPGGYAPVDNFALRHLIQIRALPAQQLLEQLRMQVTAGPQPRVGIAICDSGFGLGQFPHITPDFDLSRFPWGARSVGGNPHFPGNMGATLLLTAPGTLPKIRDTAIHPTQPNRFQGHGTAVMSVACGAGTAFVGLDATAPAIAPAAPPISNATTVPWNVGVCPMAQVLPIRIAIASTNSDSGSSTFRMASGVRFAALTPGISVVNMSYGGGLSATGIATFPFGGDKAFVRNQYKPALDALRKGGKIWVNAAGNENTTMDRVDPCVLSPTGARDKTSDPCVAACAVQTQMLPPVGPNSWMSFESRTTFSNWGTHSTLTAPGQFLVLRQATMTFGVVSGTSFSSPITAGMFGLLFLADKLARPGVVRTGDDLPNYANKLIELAEYTAFKEAPLFAEDPPTNTHEVTNRYSEFFGHGRIDVWAAVLSTLNDGPMFGVTAPHPFLFQNAELVTTFVPSDQVQFYGFELDSAAFHAQPFLVNMDTGEAEGLTDGSALDPAIDPSRPERPVWTFQLRCVGGDKYLPMNIHGTNPPATVPDALYSLQFSIRRSRLEQFTHLVFLRADDQPSVVNSPGTTDLGSTLDPDLPIRFFYGLPLERLLEHDTTSPDIVNWSVDARHFIFRAKTGEHDRLLRVTVTQVDFVNSTADITPHGLSGSLNNEAFTADGERYQGATGKTIFPGGLGFSQVFFQPFVTPLRISLEAHNSAGQIGTVNVSLPPPANPMDPNQSAWGMGNRVLTSDNGNVTFHVQIDSEPNLSALWSVLLTKVDTNNIEGVFRFAVEADHVRSQWAHIQGTSSGLGQTFTFAQVPDEQNGAAIAFAPFVPNRGLFVKFRVENMVDLTETSGFFFVPPEQFASGMDNVQIQAGDFTATVDVNKIGRVPMFESPASPASAPTFDSITPAQGPTAGGTAVVITGTGFSTANFITFGGNPAKNLLVVSDTEIRVTTPLHNADAVDVGIFLATGESATGTQAYTYQGAPQPTFSQISPAGGTTAGGTAVTITGTNFQTGVNITRVALGGVPLTNLQVTSDTQITGVTGPHAAGSVDLEIAGTSPGAPSVDLDADALLDEQNVYQYFVPPVVTSITPNTGPIGGNTDVTITGTNFSSVTDVKFGGTELVHMDFFVQTDTIRRGLTPAHDAGAVDVTLETSGDPVVVQNGFTYAGASIKCTEVSGGHFDTANSWVKPEGLTALQQTFQDLNADFNLQVMIYGHADTVGGDSQFNKTLSERRARSVMAVLTQSPSDWESLFNTEHWGVKTLQKILNAVKDPADDDLNITGVEDAATRAATTKYQQRPDHADLNITGRLDAPTRHELFITYMKLSSATPIGLQRIKSINGSSFMGCADFNPFVAGGVADEASRRTVVIVFNPADDPGNLPCKIGDLGPCRANLLGPGESPPAGDTAPATFRCKVYRRIGAACPCQGGQAAV